MTSVTPGGYYRPKPPADKPTRAGRRCAAAAEPATGKARGGAERRRRPALSTAPHEQRRRRGGSSAARRRRLNGDYLAAAFWPSVRYTYTVWIDFTSSFSRATTVIWLLPA